jgi:hypothetical protein
MRAFAFVAAVLVACGGKAAAPVAPAPTPAAPTAHAAVDGTVTTADGGKLELASVWQAHPTVLVFYRGFY